MSYMMKRRLIIFVLAILFPFAALWWMLFAWGSDRVLWFPNWWRDMELEVRKGKWRKDLCKLEDDIAAGRVKG